MSKTGNRINKLLLSFAIIIWASLGAPAQETERTWETFSPPSGDWSVLSPGAMKPDAEVSKAKSKKGAYAYNDSTGFFAVMYRDMPRVPKKLDVYYNETRDGAVKGFGGRLLRDYEFTNGAITGREIVIEGATRMERARMFFHGKRLYVVLAVLPGDEMRTPEITAYLNSFTIK